MRLVNFLYLSFRAIERQSVCVCACDGLFESRLEWKVWASDIWPIYIGGRVLLKLCDFGENSKLLQYSVRQHVTRHCIIHVKLKRRFRT